MKTLTTASDDTVQEPRISPVENPSGLRLRLAYWYLKKRLGKVITPFKVVQARIPATIQLARQLIGIQKNLSLPEDLVFYIKSLVATQNGCSFCIDIAKAEKGDRIEVEKYRQLNRFAQSDLFTPAEKTALRYVQQATKHKKVSDEVFADLQVHYTEQEIVELTLLNAMENYYNLINLPLEISSDNLCSIRDNG